MPFCYNEKRDDVKIYFLILIYTQIVSYMHYNIWGEDYMEIELRGLL